MVAKVMLFYEKKAWRAKYFSVFAYFIVFSPSAVEFLYAVFYYLRLFHKTEDGVGGLCDGLVFDM